MSTEQAGLTWMCDLVQDRFRRQMQPRQLAESGKVRTGSTEKAAEKKNLQKEAGDAKTQQGVQEDDTEHRLRIWIDNLDALNGSKMVRWIVLREILEV